MTHELVSQDYPMKKQQISWKQGLVCRGGFLLRFENALAESFTDNTKEFVKKGQDCPRHHDTRRPHRLREPSEGCEKLPPLHLFRADYPKRGWTAQWNATVAFGICKNKLEDNSISKNDWEFFILTDQAFLLDHRWSISLVTEQ